MEVIRDREPKTSDASSADTMARQPDYTTGKTMADLVDGVKPLRTRKSERSK